MHNKQLENYIREQMFETWKSDLIHLTGEGYEEMCQQAVWAAELGYGFKEKELQQILTKVFLDDTE